MSEQAEVEETKKTYNEEPYPHKPSTQSGGTHGYSVEARYMYQTPMVVGDQVFDARWRTVHFAEGAPIGVPRCASFDWAIAAANLYSYQAAQALRWWLHAECERDFKGICLETRIVRHDIEYSLKHQAVSAHMHISGEDRSNCIPDWGKK